MWIMLRLARATPGFSGADLAAIINESALGATLAGKEFIEQDDLEEVARQGALRPGQQEPRHGREGKGRDRLSRGRPRRRAVLLRPDADPMHKVTIIPRGRALGSTMTLPEKDRYTYSKRWCTAFIKMTFGGRIAEEMFTGDMNSGVSGDIRQATSIARKMITEWGMNERARFRLLRRGRDPAEHVRLRRQPGILRGNRQGHR